MSNALNFANNIWYVNVYKLLTSYYLFSYWSSTFLYIYLPLSMPQNVSPITYMPDKTSCFTFMVPWYFLPMTIIVQFSSIFAIINVSPITIARYDIVFLLSWYHGIRYRWQCLWRKDRIVDTALVCLVYRSLFRVNWYPHIGLHRDIWIPEHLLWSYSTLPSSENSSIWIFLNPLTQLMLECFEFTAKFLVDCCFYWWFYLWYIFYDLACREFLWENYSVELIPNVFWRNILRNLYQICFWDIYNTLCTIHCSKNIYQHQKQVLLWGGTILLEFYWAVNFFIKHTEYDFTKAPALNDTAYVTLSLKSGCLLLNLFGILWCWTYRALCHCES